MNQPKISVIMAAYNSSPYIGESIQSILNQTFKDFELIIVNDCSIDNTPDIIKAYSDKDPRIKVINNKTNIEPALSRNEALKIAQGDYIAILDSDDISLPYRLEVQSCYLDDHPDIALIGCGAEIINSEGSPIGRKIPSSDPEKLKFQLIVTNPLIHSGVLYRRSIVGIFGGYNNDFLHSEDYKLYSDLINNSYKIAALPDVLIKYRRSAGAITTVSSTRKVQLEHALEISFRNINKYIELKKESVREFMDTLQRRDINLKHILKSLRIYKALLRAYISEEGLSRDQAENLWDIYKSERMRLFKEYFKERFPKIINILKKT